MIDVDFLIIGQGLAGSLLAFELMRRGYRVMLVDDGGDNASKVAAGLINPVTGMRWVKSADVDMLLPVAQRFYRHLAEALGQMFYIEKPMLRLFRNEAEIQRAEQRLKSASYQAYLDAIQPAGQVPGITAPFGFIRQRQTGYLLTRPLLASLKAFFIAHDSYRQARFDYRDLVLALKPRWRDISAGRVIFCEGHLARANPWFSWLPFQIVKGEILDLQCERGQLPDVLLNYRHWLIPLTENQFRTGATFEHKQLDCQPTALAKNRLLAGLAGISENLAQAMITDHQAGIRPCTLDKQPFIGLHPRHPELAVFNGFGAKGSLQIPYYSQGFADFLAGFRPPPADISRHYAAHFPG